MKTKYLALGGLIMTVTVMAGCGTAPVDIKQNQEAIASAKSMRAYFEQSKGDFNALSPTDKAAAQKIAGGGPEDVQKEFDFMKTSNKTAAPKQ